MNRQAFLAVHSYDFGAINWYLHISSVTIMALNRESFTERRSQDFEINVDFTRHH